MMTERLLAKKPAIVLTMIGVMACLYLANPRMAWGDEKVDAPAVRVVVDPRVELMSIIFRLAGSPEYNRARVGSYAKDVDLHFAAVRNHAVVQRAKRLRESHGVAYDACMSMAIHLTDVAALAEKVPLDPHPSGLDERWPLEESRAFLVEARQFAKEGRFDEFFAAHRSLYERTEARMKTLLDQEAHLEWFDTFFGPRPQASFTVALAPLNGPGNYGPHCQLADGKEELYCILGVWSTDDDGLPVFSSIVLEVVIHEFCHSYVNPIVDRHMDELKGAGEKLFPKVAAAMRRQAYGNWRTMMYESLVRACTIRYLAHYQGPASGILATLEQHHRRFLWIDGLAELLAKYEKQREQYPALDSYFPQIVTFFNDYAEHHAK